MLIQAHDCAGMAGSGKTTLMQRMAAHLSDAGTPAYVLNLDPAVMTVPYGANIDIRDTVCSLHFNGYHGMHKLVQ